MKLLLLSLCLFSASTFAVVPTKFSELIQYAQKTYADKFTDYPILIFDLDEVEMRYAKAKVYGEGKELEKKRTQIVKQYVLEKTGVELDDNDAMTFESYTYALKGGAYAMPIRDGWGKDSTYIMCGVFPASPNSNQRLETERITGLKTPGAYKDITYTGLQEKLTYEEMQLFSLYHELGHCMDRTFLPASYTSYEVAAHDVHLSESFAETFGLFMLEKEGFAGTGRTRALLRNMYTQEMGKWFIENPQNAFGNQLYLQGGVIYYLSPVLLAADEYLARNRKFVKEASIEELLTKSKEIVEAFALDGRSMSSIYRAMEHGEEKIVTELREWALKNPKFFLQTQKDVLQFLDFSPYLLGLIVGNEPDVNEGVMLASIEDTCTMTEEAFYLQLQSLRDELKEEGLAYESQTQRKKDLDSLYETYSKCSVVD